jgi:hypothetical protein
VQPLVAPRSPIDPLPCRGSRESGPLSVSSRFRRLVLRTLFRFPRAAPAWSRRPPDALTGKALPPPPSGRDLVSTVCTPGVGTPGYSLWPLPGPGTIEGSVPSLLLFRARDDRRKCRVSSLTRTRTAGAVFVAPTFTFFATPRTGMTQWKYSKAQRGTSCSVLATIPPERPVCLTTGAATPRIAS